MSARKTMAKGFTLVEILIVVVILGILAAIVIPQFTRASETARASSLQSQLQTIRSQLELYQVQHNGVYPTLTTNWDDLTTAGADGYGPYLQKAPVNPFTDGTGVNTDASESWQYIQGTGEIKAVLPSDVWDDIEVLGLGTSSNNTDFVLQTASGG